MEKVLGTDKKHVMSASTLKSDSVVNARGEDLGKIEDIMIHMGSGRVAYAVLSFGGFLGIGDKLFAIPWEALSLDEDEKHFILDIDREKLENAPGFDKNDWPDMADAKFGSQVYTYYGYEEPSWMSGGRGFIPPRGHEHERCAEMGTC